ncbi:outer membrane lipoprotein carrier protein LolA [Echinicola marina]|uniref:LolA family protein n=1 Tax=Echinicola marina TaxID=2859768 RepID=UPI001CF6A70F|nr:outer membrane lipoprotein carrier protein LolA [Echinicola marina]UCS95158.1 outer membrane lipoprotein carrier protein LolA [Echinicola marina]
MLKRILLFTVLIIGFQGLVWGQKDPKAKLVLDQVSERYQSLSGVQATFEYYYYNDIDGASQSSTGEVAVKGNRYKLVLDDQEIYNNGETVWTYIKTGDYKEVTINTVSDDPDELTPSSIYNLYKKGYDYVLIGDEKLSGKLVQRIKLTAENQNAQFSTIILYVDKANKDLMGWEVSDADGGSFKYQFKNVKTNVDLKNSFFAFDVSAHVDVEVIDLR